MIKLSGDMQRAVEAIVRSRIGDTAILDVQATAEDIRLAFLEQNVAHEDIAASIAQFATSCGYPVELAPRISEQA